MTAVSMVFTKKSQGEGSRQYGVLAWGGTNYQCITGGYGKGPLPDGWYDIRVRHAVVGNASDLKPGFIDNLSTTTPKSGWFLPLVAKGSTLRRGFGIHPDGNLPGTEGCVGLLGEEAAKFWQRWNGLGFSTRPTSLQVLTGF